MTTVAVRISVSLWVCLAPATSIVPLTCGEAVRTRRDSNPRPLIRWRSIAARRCLLVARGASSAYRPVHARPPGVRRIVSRPLAPDGGVDDYGPRHRSSTTGRTSRSANALDPETRQPGAARTMKSRAVQAPSTRRRASGSTLRYRHRRSRSTRLTVDAAHGRRGLGGVARTCRCPSRRSGH
jgi:hypothetical protein